MKKILFISALLVSLFAMSGCGDDNINSPALTTDEYPRILGRWPDKKSDGALGEFNIPLNQILVINVQYTPAEWCEGIWYLDGREIHRGVGLEYVPSTEGNFHLKLVVKTPAMETTREATVNVIAPVLEE